jgi:hypothetical protein
MITNKQMTATLSDGHAITVQRKSNTSIPDRSVYATGVEYYFLGQCLLTLLAVLLAIIWRVINTDIKRMEPFYALSDPQGSPASSLTRS